MRTGQRRAGSDRDPDSCPTAGEDREALCEQVARSVVERASVDAASGVGDVVDHREHDRVDVVDDQPVLRCEQRPSLRERRPHVLAVYWAIERERADTL